MTDLTIVQTKFKCLSGFLDERTRRIWAATEAQAIGWGGVSLVAKATGLSRGTIHIGIKEAAEKPARRENATESRRTRRPGGGRKPVTHHRPGLVAELERLVEPTTCGDPMSPLRWTCKSTAELARALSKKGSKVGARTVAALLHDLEYSLQGNYKTKEGSEQRNNRDAQFRHIKRQTEDFQRRRQPVISVDTKKKELIGDFKNGAPEWRPNSYRARLWKTELQRLATETALAVSVCHFPPGTSKWNKIEHRMFCHITQNWRARPLVSQEVVVNLIGSTTTEAGLTVRARLDKKVYPKGIEVTDAELAQVKLRMAAFHGEWNYTISP